MPPQQNPHPFNLPYTDCHPLPLAVERRPVSPHCCRHKCGIRLPPGTPLVATRSKDSTPSPTMQRSESTTRCVVESESNQNQALTASFLQCTTSSMISRGIGTRFFWKNFSRRAQLPSFFVRLIPLSYECI